MPACQPIARGAELATAGRPQLIVTCPYCSEQHRHLTPGPRRSPCGRRYIVAAPAARHDTPRAAGRS